MKNLMSISEHSDWLENNYNLFSKKWELHRNRVNFGKQNLEKWMFVACDEDGNVLEFPTKENSLNTIDHENRMMEYQQAKSRCLFKIQSLEEETEDYWYFGVDGITLICVEKIGTIEDLIKYNLELTATAKK